MTRLEEVRKIVSMWRPIMEDHRGEYEGSVFPAAVDLMDAVEGLLMLADIAETPGAASLLIHPDAIRAVITEALEAS